MSRPRILVNVQQLATRPAPFLERLRAAGYELVIHDGDRLLTEAELIARMPGVVATMAGGEPYTEAVFAAAPDLRVVARFGVGYDRVDVAAASRHGVAVAMAFGANHESVADYAFGMIMALGLEMRAHHDRVASGGWGTDFHPGVWGRTRGRGGLGRIGRATARRARGFGMRVIGFDPVADTALMELQGIEWLPLDAVLRQADFVSIHTPLTAATRNIIGARELALMKPTAFLVNTARGGLIDEAALHAALTGGHLAGAGLDVFEAEPPEGSPLIALDNVILAPHAAGLDDAGEALMANACIDNILAIADGRDPGGGRLLNPDVLDGPTAGTAFRSA